MDKQISRRSIKLCSILTTFLFKKYRDLNVELRNYLFHSFDFIFQGKATIRQLKNQLEDLECARSMAVKVKQSLETELLETQAMLEESHKQRQEAEDRANSLLREKTDLQTQLEENEEELAEVLKKFKGTVQQMSLDQLALQEQVSLVSELEVERNQLKEQLAELTSRLESVESMGDPSSNLLVKRYLNNNFTFQNKYYF